MNKQSDLTFLKSFTAGDSSKMSKYINMFLAATPKSLEQMKQQLAISDWKGLRTTAHSMKSQLKYMGITGAEQVAISIEKIAAEENGVEQIPDLYVKLVEITGTACNELREELTTL